jgi:hypothetical protein
MKRSDFPYVVLLVILIVALVVGILALFDYTDSLKRSSPDKTCEVISNPNRGSYVRECVMSNGDICYLYEDAISCTGGH